MDLKKLIDLLPYYFKENDTYKDSNGKGILERFLEICGSYFEDQVVDNTAQILENLDVDKCPDYLLQYFWEWFGCIPFAEGEFIDPNKWAQYYNGFDPKSEYESKKHYWLYDNPNDPLNLSLDTKRRILKYAVSLLKCRGSKVFFDTMFRLYGIKAEVDEQTGLNAIEDHTQRDVIFDDGQDGEYALFDKKTFDWETYCTQCIPVYFNITYSDQAYKDNNNFEPTEKFTNFVTAITNFINKYIPFNAHPIIKFYDSDGSSIVHNKIYYIRVTNLTTGESLLWTTMVNQSSETDSNRIVVNPVIVGVTRLLYKVEVWSEEDPEGKNSTWASFQGSINNWDDVVIGTEHYTKGQGVFYFDTKNSHGGVYNVQSLRAYREQESGIQKIAYIQFGPGETIIEPPTSTLRYEWGMKAVTADGSVIYNPTSIDVNDKLYIYSAKFTNDLNATDYNLGITVRPTGLVVNNPGSDNWREVTNLTPGDYYLGIEEDSRYGSRINIIDEQGFDYLITCEPESQNLSSIKDVQDVLITITPDGIEKGTEAYDRAMFLINGKEVLYSKNDNRTFVYTEGGFRYTKNYIKNFGVYDFTCNLNRNSIMNIQPYMGRFVINQQGQVSAWAKVDSITPSPLDITPKEDQVVDRNLNIQVSKAYGPGNETIRDGHIRVIVHCGTDTDGSYEDADKWFNQYAANRVSAGHYDFTGIVPTTDDNHGQFNLEVPYVTYQDEDGRTIAYTGYLEIEFYYERTTMIINREVNSGYTSVYIIFNPEAIYTPEYITIIPNNPNDNNWLDYITQQPINWNSKYDGTEATEDNPCVGQAIYQKVSEDSEAAFKIYGTTVGSYTYVNENGDSTKVELEDVSEFRLKDPGTYTFNAQFKEYPQNQDDEYKDIIIVVKDFEPIPSISCYPTEEIIENDATFGIIQKIDLTLTPDSPRVSHRVVVFDGCQVDNDSGNLVYDSRKGYKVSIYDATNEVTNVQINLGNAVICWEGNFTDIKNTGYTPSDWNNHKSNWVLNTNYCTYSYGSKSDKIKGISIIPVQDYINLEKTTATTTVTLLDSNNQALVGDDYMIKCNYTVHVAGATQDVEQEEMHVSPWTFTTSIIPVGGTFKFSAVAKSDISGTFTVTDVKPKISQLNILDNDVTAVGPYTGPKTLSFQILDSQGGNISFNEQLDESYLDAYLRVTVGGVPYSNGTGYFLTKGNNCWVINFYETPVWNNNGSIQISLEGASDTWNYTYEEPVVPSGVELSNLRGSGSANPDNNIPGIWVCTAKIKNSDGSYMLESEFKDSGDLGTLYVNGVPYTYYKGSWGDEAFAEGNYFTTGQINSYDDYWLLFVYLKESPSSIYWQWKGINSNTLNASGEPAVTSYRTIGILTSDDGVLDDLFSKDYNDRPWRYPKEGSREVYDLPLWVKPGSSFTGWYYGPCLLCVLEVFSDGHIEARPDESIVMTSDNSEGYLVCNYGEGSGIANMVPVKTNNPMSVNGTPNVSSTGKKELMLCTVWDQNVYVTKDYTFKIPGNNDTSLVIKASNEDREGPTVNKLYVRFGVSSSFSGDDPSNFRYGITFEMSLQTEDGFSTSDTFVLDRQSEGLFIPITHDYQFGKVGNEFKFKITKASSIAYRYQTGTNSQPEAGANMEMEVRTYDGSGEGDIAVISGGDNRSVCYLEPNTWHQTQELSFVSDYNFNIAVSKSGDIYLDITLSVSN